MHEANYPALTQSITQHLAPLRKSQQAAALAPAAPLCALSGPEGGFTDAEEAAALAAGFAATAAGPRVLRAETAPLAVLAWLALQEAPAPPR